jgi:dodecin
MTDHVYKSIEITGTAKTTIEDAVNNALTKASDSVRNMRWLEVTGIRGHIEGQRLTQWQVTMKVGFRLEE